MSFKRTATYPCAPQTTRGESTKISSHGDKIVYTNGKTVVIRDLNTPEVGITYSGHVQPATVARISPSGYYCASADASGTVRVWDIAGTDQALKGEYKVIAGKLNDLAWDGESKRIIAAGDGREKFAHPFMFDSGSSCGEIGGHNKPINAVSIRAQRPFRAVTASDDGLVVLHSGAPYKYMKTIQTHSRFVQDVQYAPNGNAFVSVGSDYKIFVYEGTNGDVLGEVEGEGHKGTIYATTWKADSSQFATASADGSVKVWDATTRKLVKTYTLGSGVDNQQVGATWTGKGIVSVNMAGDLTLLDEGSSEPKLVLRGAQKSITAGAVTSSSGTFIAGSYDGRVVRFESSGKADVVPGPGHTGQVVGVAAMGDGRVVSVGFDDCAREIGGGGGEKFGTTTVALGGQPRALSAVGSDATAFVASTAGVSVVKDGQRVAHLKVDYDATSVGAGAGGVVAVGAQDNKIRLYDWKSGALSPRSGTLDANRGAVSAVAFSPDGKLLAAGDSTGKIVVYDVATAAPTITRWSFHSGRIASLVWRADGLALVSGSLDTHVYVWSVKVPAKYVAIRNAVPGGCAVVGWRGDKEVLGAGADACVRVWSVEVPQ
ncbi:WD40 repeat-like protein [Exidia glandulosa HHB12029]|uniref:WD40 repeat-like protein n=1 Tax=Exidia glandulosa HHB12029 TaxID=1314781 RepID=A0A165DSK4_EXIGL|nr:WD40 repeat-like protein [Exidia glandulosa HHB12029]